MRYLIYLMFSVFTLLGFAYADNVHEFNLKNGMKILVKEDHRAPVVVSMVWYKVGSAYETTGITGISHALEHMMFKGTKKHGPGEFAKLISTTGGEENAFTAQDFTAYYEEVSVDHLPMSFELEADRMSNLLITDEEFKKEIQVVKEERLMRTDDNPQSLTWERFCASAFINYGYHHQPIGWMSDLDNLTAEDLRAWYHRWYGPNNAILVVVGDVEPNKVEQMAQKYFGALKPIALTPLKKLPEPPALGVKKLIVKAPAKVPWIVVGWNVPSLTTVSDPKEAYALTVLGAILDGGDSSRFAKDLIRKQQLVTSADASYDAFSLLSTVMVLDGTPSRGREVKDVQKALLDQVKQLQLHLVNAEELERVKNQAVAAKVFDKDSLMGQAMQIGALESIGLSWKLGEDFATNLRAVSAADIQAVAKKYLVSNRLTIAELKPLPIDPNTNMESKHLGDNYVH